MKTLNRFEHPVFKFLTVILILGSMAYVLYRPSTGQAGTGNNIVTNEPLLPDSARIQLAILLDTSSSMSGLIDQTRNQLWQVVNEFSQTKKDGVIPVLEVAVYEYGNSNLSRESGHIRQVSELTRNLDIVSESLFSLTTNGGNEYCGAVIEKAVNDIQWSHSDEDIKVIFIAGNEPFTQGPVSYQHAVNLAKEKGITVNTIHAGDYNKGINTGWQQGAVLAGGNYMSIDHNHKVAHIVAPQDQEIAELNRRLNSTYVPYGPRGQEGAGRQSSVDEKNNNVSLGLLAKRVKSKISSFYDNSDWDLVDAFNNGSASPETLEEDQLPAEMKGMNDKQKLDYVKNKTEERERVKQQIADLTREREDYVAEVKAREPAAPVNTMNEAMTRAIREQAKVKDFELQKN